MTQMHAVQKKAWTDAKKKYRNDQDGLNRWAWRKVKNGIDVTRHQRPDQKIVNVTIATEPGKKREDLSTQACLAAAFVCAKLASRGHDFDYRVEQTDGVVYATPQIRTLQPIAEPVQLKLVS